MMMKLFVFAFAAVLPLLFLGIINRTKARWAGRKGASVVQPYFDMLRL
ncbi:MAG: hydrogenase, partial [Ignavibacteriae bacterium]